MLWPRPACYLGDKFFCSLCGFDSRHVLTILEVAEQRRKSKILFCKTVVRVAFLVMRLMIPNPLDGLLRVPIFDYLIEFLLTHDDHIFIFSPFLQFECLKFANFTISDLTVG